MDVGKVGILIVLLLVVPTISAQIYQQSTDIDLKVPFEVDGSAANSSAQCNVSIKYPNSTYLKNNAGMTNGGAGEFNITLSTDETSSLGEYEWVAFCCQLSNCAAGYGSFEVTPSGTVPTTAQGIVYLLSLLVVGGLFLLSLYGAITLKWGNPRASTGKVLEISDLKYLKVGLWFISYLLFIFILAIMKGVTGNFLVFNDAYRFFSVTFEISLRMIIPILLGSLGIIIFNVFADKKLYEDLSRFSEGRR